MNKLLKDISVLVVEDEKTLNEAYVRILRSENITVETSYNGVEALEKLEKMDPEPDIILLDLKMPHMDGIEFLSQLAKKKPPKKAKVVIFSNFDRQSEIDDAFSLGASKYILKAWASPKEIVEVVRETTQATS